VEDVKRHFDFNGIIGLVGMSSARIVSPTISFLVIVLVARMLGQEILGKYMTVWVWFVFFRAFSIFGSAQFISKQVAVNRNEVSEYQTHGLFFGFLFSLVCAAAMVGVAFLLNYPDDVKYGIIIASMVLPFHACSVICQAVLTAFQKIKAISLIWISENFLFLATAAVVIFAGYGFLYLFWCLVLARLLAAVFNLFIVHRYIAPLRFQIDWKFFWHMLSPLVIFGVSSVAYQIFVRIDVIMLSKMADMATVGLYSSASNLMEVCILLPAIFYTLNFPIAAEGYKSMGEQIHRKIEVDSRQLFVLVFLIFGFGFFFSDVIIPLIYGSSFLEAGWILRILMLAFLIQGAETILTMSCLAAGYHKMVMYIIVSRAAVNIALNLVFIPAYGAMGAAVATVLSISFSFAAFQVFMTRHMGSFRWIRVVGKPALACLLIIAVLFPLTNHLNTLLLGSMFLIGYGLVLFALKGFSPVREKFI
jgi:O-antigen/teichoic acid export membrane protein